jgi:hypothetical protein
MRIRTATGLVRRVMGLFYEPQNYSPAVDPELPAGQEVTNKQPESVRTLFPSIPQLSRAHGRDDQFHHPLFLLLRRYLRSL